MGLFFPLSRSPKASLPGWGKSNSELTVMDGWLRTSGNLFREMEIFGITCRFLTLEGLIKAKRAVGRAKDLKVLPELEALLEIRKREVS